jgi:hypothetical protein
MQRNTAFHVRISDIVNGQFSADQEGAYIEVDNKKISRVNIMGILVSKDGNIVIDDGSGIISLAGFDNEVMEKTKLGDAVIVIGRVQESESQKVIIPYILKKTDKRWLQVRAEELRQRLEKKELANPEAERMKIKPATKIELKTENQKPTTENRKPKTEISVLDYIRENDRGPGLEIDSVISKLKIKEEKIQQLLEAGEIFVVKPGFVKVLE